MLKTGLFHLTCIMRQSYGKSRDITNNFPIILIENVRNIAPRVNLECETINCAIEFRYFPARHFTFLSLVCATKKV